MRRLRVELVRVFVTRVLLAPVANGTNGTGRDDAPYVLFSRVRVVLDGTVADIPWSGSYIFFDTYILHIFSYIHVYVYTYIHTHIHTDIQTDR